MSTPITLYTSQLSPSTSIASVPTILGWFATDDDHLAASMQIPVSRRNVELRTVLIVVGLRPVLGNLICCEQVTLIDGRVSGLETLRGDLVLGVCTSVSI